MMGNQTEESREDIHESGARVRARYCGGWFRGTVLRYRHHTINHQAVEYHIAPDEPFETVIGTLDRDVVLVYATWDGQPCSYDQFEGQIEPELDGGPCANCSQPVADSANHFDGKQYVCS